MPPGTPGQYPGPTGGDGEGAAAPPPPRGAWARLLHASTQAALAFLAWLLVLVGSSGIGLLAWLLLRFCMPHLRRLPPTQHGFWSGAGALVQAIVLPPLATASGLLLVTSASVVALCLLLLVLPAAFVGGPVYFVMRLYATASAAQHALAVGFGAVAVLFLARLLMTQPAREPVDRGIEGWLAWYFLASGALALFVPHDTIVELVRWLVHLVR